MNHWLLGAKLATNFGGEIHVGRNFFSDSESWESVDLMSISSDDDPRPIDRASDTHNKRNHFNIECGVG